MQGHKGRPYAYIAQADTPNVTPEIEAALFDLAKIYFPKQPYLALDAMRFAYQLAVMVRRPEKP